MLDTGRDIQSVSLDGWMDRCFPSAFGPLLTSMFIVLEEGSMPRDFKKHWIPFFYLNAVSRSCIDQKNTFGNQWIMPLFYKELWIWSFRVLVLMQIINLTAYGAILLRQFVFNVKSESGSDAEHIKSKWLKRVIWFYNGFAWSYLSYWILVWTNLIKVEYDYTISFMTAFIYMTGYLGFVNAGNFNGIEQRKKKRKLNTRGLL